MLSFLRAQLRRAEKCKLMKMIVVGPPRQGKSSLLEILQTGRAPQLVHGDATIKTTKWELQRPAGSRAKVKDGQRAEGPWAGGRELPRALSVLCREPRTCTPGRSRGAPCAVPHQLLPRAVGNFLT